MADWNQVKRARNTPITPRRIPKGQVRTLPGCSACSRLGPFRQLHKGLFEWQVLPQTTPVSLARQSVQKASKQSKAKSANPGRTYTSKYRGVHQTFPTKRWEAQFRYSPFSTVLVVLMSETD